MIELIVGGVVVAGVIGVIAAASMYRIVPPMQAHLVVTPRGRWVVSPDEKVADNGRRTYFAIPAVIPFVGRTVRKMDMTIKEIIVQQETYEKGQARYNVKSSTKYRIKDVKRAAETFINDEDLESQLQEVINSSVRAITVRYDVVEARALKSKMSEEITKEMTDDLEKWGLELITFQLVDFQDTEQSKIISDISKRREVEIQATTREQNAEKLKQARLKEAEADEAARQREIERDQRIGEQEQKKIQFIAEQEKAAETKKYAVLEVQTVRQAEIDKEQAIIKAKQEQATEEILKQKKLLEGQGDRLRAEEQAKGDAAPIREKGFAEAEAKEKLQAALNKFKDEAIRALVAEQIVAMQKDVGIETARALSNADLKVFAGGKNAEQGFDLGALIEATKVSNNETAESIMNRIARPNDMGFKALGLKAVNETEVKKKKKIDVPAK